MKNTKIFAISILSVFAVAPSMAAPTHTSATFPQSGVMEEDYQYTGQANVTNLKVSSGTANTLAGYTDCPSGYPNSDAGATSTDECYKACTVADLPANSHAATASGKNYSGTNVTDTCAIATCETGYTFNNGACDANIITVNWDHADAADITANNAGTVTYGGNINTPKKAQHINGKIFTGWTFVTPTPTYDFSSLDASVDGTNYTYDESNKTWATNFSYGDVSGVALCSVTSGTFGVAGTPDESGTGDTTNCWCKATGYTPSGSNTTYENSSSSSWVCSHDIGSASDCASTCASDCGIYVQGISAFRRAVLGITQ